MLLDFIFPKRCVACRKVGDYLCPNCFSYLSFNVQNYCLSCNKPSINSFTHPGCKHKHTIDACFSAIPYNKTAQKLIYNFKYKPFVSDLAEFLTDLIFESLSQNEDFINASKNIKKWYFAPVPLSGKKFKKRGYNQSEILAKKLAFRFNLEFIDPLERIKDTKTQVGLKLKERRGNVKGAFEIRKNFKTSLKNSGVLLVDDIVTTGSTLLEAGKVLKRQGAQKVIGITLARD